MRYSKTTSRWMSGAALLVVGVSCATAAMAQQAPAPGARSQEVIVSANVMYDSNVAASSDALAAARGIRPSDEIITPSVSFSLSRPVGRETIFLQGSAGYDFYARNHFLNRERLDIRPGVIAEVGQCQATVSGGYSRYQSSLRELALIAPGTPGFADVRNVVNAENVGISANCGRQIGLAPNASVSENWSDNSATFQKFADSRTFSASGGLAYRSPSLGVANLFFQYSTTDFPSRLAILGPVSSNNGYDVYSGGINYTKNLGTKIQGTASISYEKLIQKASPVGGFSGLTYSANISYRATSRLSALLILSRGITPSTRINSTYSISQSYSGELDYKLGNRLNFKLIAAHLQDHYGGLAVVSGFDLTDQSIDRQEGAASFQLTRRIALGLDVTHEQRGANFAGLSYSDVRVGLSAKASF